MDMATNNYFDHTSLDGRQLGDRVTNSGFSWHAVGENIARGAATPSEVVKRWLKSPGHRANILKCTFTHIGVGEAPGSKGPYWTQDFGTH
jgi:uncharacterized protein YkwD